MKTTTEKKFDAVKFMRQQRKILSDKLAGMTQAEVIAYFRNRKSKLKIKPGT